jgi:3'-5' exoribonuclease
MPPLNLATLRLGDRVDTPLRVTQRVERFKTNGELFVILSLGNNSGQIDAEPIWSNQLDAGWADNAELGVVVWASGHITQYVANGSCKRQLRLTTPLRPLPHEKLQIEDFLPSIGNIAGLWNRLERLRRGIRSRTLQKVLALFFDDADFRARFGRAPASVGGHHCAVGGLVSHVYEVACIARTAARIVGANSDLLVAGALLHDIGKVEAYEVGWAGFGRTPRGHLLEHVALGCLMLERALTAADEHICSDEQRLELQHLILSHHGMLEFGSPVRPLTLEAELLHWADETSSKANDVSECLTDPSAFRHGQQFADQARLWRVERRTLWRRPHAWE